MCLLINCTSQLFRAYCATGSLVSAENPHLLSWASRGSSHKSRPSRNTPWPVSFGIPKVCRGCPWVPLHLPWNLSATRVSSEPSGSILFVLEPKWNHLLFLKLSYDASLWRKERIAEFPLRREKWWRERGRYLSWRRTTEVWSGFPLEVRHAGGHVLVLKIQSPRQGWLQYWAFWTSAASLSFPGVDDHFSPILLITKDLPPVLLVLMCASFQPSLFLFLTIVVFIMPRSHRTYYIQV